MTPPHRGDAIPRRGQSGAGRGSTWSAARRRRPPMSSCRGSVQRRGRGPRTASRRAAEDGAERLRMEAASHWGQIGTGNGSGRASPNSSSAHTEERTRGAHPLHVGIEPPAIVHRLHCPSLAVGASDEGHPGHGRGFIRSAKSARSPRATQPWLTRAGYRRSRCIQRQGRDAWFRVTCLWEVVASAGEAYPPRPVRPPASFRSGLFLAAALPGAGVTLV